MCIKPALAQERLGLALRGLDFLALRIGELLTADALLVAHVGVAERAAQHNPAGVGKVEGGEETHDRRIRGRERAQGTQRGELPTLNAQPSTFKAARSDANELVGR